VSDINECNNTNPNITNQCDVLSTTCVNDPGTYHCVCLPGFYGSAGSMSCTGNYIEVIYSFICYFMYLLL